MGTECHPFTQVSCLRVLDQFSCDISTGRAVVGPLC